MTTTPIVSIKPLTITTEHRDHDLRVRVTAPLTGDDLPVVVFVHGFGANLDGYAPLTDHWAAHGFVVIQATHHDAPGDPAAWRLRVLDVRRILDELGSLAPRADRSRVVAAGHSFGGQTAGVLVGLRVTDPVSGVAEDLSDPRVMASIQLATAGAGGDHLTPFALEHAPWLREQDFSHMTRPGLVVAGDRDELPLSTRGPSWTTDPYTLRGGDRSLVVVPGGEHFLGGISGYRVAETTDEDPERVALVQRVTLEFLRRVTGVKDR
ncbi:alpha/beta hydrolase family protein [Actinoplanes couchii]|nr:chlorophyllase [Actinoplanes couchii]MDR6319195.1 fermentation-respiration switch protein FrsA (DUF1100 family) [Actinoplanes couchii]